MNIVLFDLDFTLIPIDSDYQWNKYIINIGVINYLLKEKNNIWYKKYILGILNNTKYLKFNFNILKKYSKIQLFFLNKYFIKKIINPIILNKSIILIKNHKKKNHFIIIITATNSFITKPISKILKINFLISYKYKNNFFKIPTYSIGKIYNLKLWFKKKKIKKYKKIFFYSDSNNDIPLLSIVNYPIAINSNNKLKKHSILKNWSIIDNFK